MGEDATVDEAHSVAVGPAPGGGERFPCFDGLRALAALAVFLFHWGPALYTLTYWERLMPALRWLARLGHVGVAVFFVISGFLLFRPFVLAHFQGRPVPQVAPFWLRRFARILPGYWFALAITFLVLETSRPESWTDYFTYFGLLQNYRSGYESSAGLIVAWTLVIEVSFYLALPGIAWVLRKVSRPDAPARSKLQAHVVGLVVMALAGTLVRALLLASPPTVVSTGTWFPLHQVEGFWIFGYLDWFAFGMLMAVASAWIAIGGGVPRVLAVLGRHSYLPWLLALECFWVLTRLHAPYYVFGGISPLQGFMRGELSGIAAALIVLPAVFGDQSRGVVRQLLRSVPLVALGLVSYGIYLWHVPVSIAYDEWSDELQLPLNPFLVLGITLVVTVVAAAISYFAVERPVVEWARHRARHPRFAARPATIAAASPSAPAERSAAVTITPAPSAVGAEPVETGPPASLVLVPFVLVIGVLGFVLPTVLHPPKDSPLFAPAPGHQAPTALVASPRPVTGTTRA